MNTIKRNTNDIFPELYATRFMTEGLVKQFGLKEELFEGDSEIFISTVIIPKKIDETLILSWLEEQYGDKEEAKIDFNNFNKSMALYDFMPEKLLIKWEE